MRCLVRRERYLPCQSEFMECLGESLCNGYVMFLDMKVILFGL